MSSEPPVISRKQTIYDGPEVDLFKPRQLQREAAPASGKETIHNGDVPDFISRRFSPTAAAEPLKSHTETVYQGHHIPEMFLKLGRIAQDLVMPDRETIYQGPEIVQQVVDITHLSDSSSGSQKETVFDENTFIAKKIDTTAARSLVTRLVQRASVRFFAVAILSLVELYLCRHNLPVAISSGIMFLTFSVVGFYTFKLNLKALLCAVGIYALTTLFMVVNAYTTDSLYVLIIPLFSRGFMIYNLLRTYGLLVDLHLLEAEIY